MEEKISLVKALELIRDELKRISIPVEHINGIGIPVANSVNNLEQLIIAARRIEEETASLGAQDSDEPKIELVETVPE